MSRIVGCIVMDLITSVDVSVDGGGFESVQVRCRVQERVQSDVGLPSGLQAAAGNVSG